MDAISMTTQTRLPLAHTPTAAQVTRLRTLLALHAGYVSRLPGIALAYTLVQSDMVRGADYLTLYHAPYFDTLHGVHALREQIRECLHTCETGQPGHTVWFTRPLADMDDVLARARLLVGL